MGTRPQTNVWKYCSNSKNNITNVYWVPNMESDRLHLLAVRPWEIYWTSLNSRHRWWCWFCRGAERIISCTEYSLLSSVPATLETCFHSAHSTRLLQGGSSLKNSPSLQSSAICIGLKDWAGLRMLLATLGEVWPNFLGSPWSVHSRYQAWGGLVLCWWQNCLWELVKKWDSWSHMRETDTKGL